MAFLFTGTYGISHRGTFTTKQLHLLAHHDVQRHEHRDPETRT